MARILAAISVLVAAATLHAQVGRGGSEWLTARGDAQRTSWIRTDAKISVDSMSKPGFELQWTTKLDNRARGAYGLGQGVTANGVTLFVPMSIVGGSSNNVYAIDNDTGYLVWQRHFDASLPAPSEGCPGGMTAAATRIVSLAPPPVQAAAAPAGGRAAQAYRSVIGEAGQGVPLEARGRGPSGPPPAAAPGTPAATATPPGAPAPAGARGAAPGAGGGGGGRGNPGPPIPGAPPSNAGGFGRPSGVVYAISSDGVLHVLGLQSGKDIQRPAEFFPANARWSDAIAVNTTLYTTTSGKCAGTPNGVWGIDLESEGKPVVSWKSSEDLVGALAFTTDGTAVVAKTNGIVTLDAKTLQEKGAFSAAGTSLVTGPAIFTHNGKEIVAAGTKDGRVVLLDAAALGGTTPLVASQPIAGTGSISADSLATWENGTRWILVPMTGGIVALKLNDTGGTLSLEPGWSTSNLSAPATPIIVNGVVFALATGRPVAAGGAGTPAVLHAYDGTSGKELWSSGTTMKSFASPGSFWSAMGQMYVGTSDGTLYAFGFVDERR